MKALLVLLATMSFVVSAAAADNDKPSKFSFFGFGQKKKERINLNTASAAELAKLPGIGKQFAQAIVEARPYKSLDGLKKVKGLSSGTISSLKDLVSTN